nr:hypothetical protein [uncultured Cellulosilyticum sp.]
MEGWKIEFVLPKLRGCKNEQDHKRVLVKDETIISLKIDDMSLNILLNCTDELKSSFCNDETLKEDIQSIIDNMVSLDMIKYYYVSKFQLDFTNKKGQINLNYPKVNLMELM